MALSLELALLVLFPLVSFIVALLFTLTILFGIAYIESNLQAPARVPIRRHQGARRRLFANN